MKSWILEIAPTLLTLARRAEGLLLLFIFLSLRVAMVRFCGPAKAPFFISGRHEFFFTLMEALPDTLTCVFG